MSVDEQVAKHFEADADRFDTIYEGDKGWFAQWVDTRWRGVVGRRLDLSLALLTPLEGKTVLDVGCGSGRYCVAFAQAGAARVVGIDFAGAMIAIAERLTGEAGVSERCEYITGSFPDDAPGGPFDAITAMGYFDYVADPVTHIAAMRERCDGTMVMSFPKSREWRVPVRRARFAVNRCPLFLYRRERIERILGEAGVTRYELVDFGRDFIAVAHP